MNFKPGSLEGIPCIKDIADIPRQYIHKQKSYSRNSPLRNKQNLLRARGKTNNSFSGNTSISKTITRFSAADKFFNKIISAQSENKENATSRFYSAKKHRILSELPEQFSTFDKSDGISAFMANEQAEIIKDYKATQSKIRLLTKSKLPHSIMGFMLRHTKKLEI